MSVEFLIRQILQAGYKLEIERMPPPIDAAQKVTVTKGDARFTHDGYSLEFSLQILWLEFITPQEDPSKAKPGVIYV
jgi:hypothetical protein